MLRWFTDNANSSQRVLCPDYMGIRINRSFTLGYSVARRDWGLLDVDCEWIILDRKQLSHAPVKFLQTVFARMREVYRDETHSVLTHLPIESNLSGDRWPELEAILRGLTLRDDTVDVTVVLNVFVRPPAQLRRQIKGILDQTVTVREIWVCSFGAEQREAYEKVVDGFNDPRLQFITSTNNLKYYGRFQLALQATTEYVAFIDDDIIIGRDYLRRCLETIQEHADIAGEVGIYGWGKLPGPNETNRVQHYLTGEWEEHPPHKEDGVGTQGGNPLVEVDFLCGFHFVRRELIRLMFREGPWTFASGEDFQLAFAIRKYAGLGAYIIPVNGRH